MIRANIEAEIQSIIKKQNIVRNAILQLDKDIAVLKERQKAFLEANTDYTYKLEELREQLEDENE